MTGQPMTLLSVTPHLVIFSVGPNRAVATPGDLRRLRTRVEQSRSGTVAIAGVVLDESQVASLQGAVTDAAALAKVGEA